MPGRWSMQIQRRVDPLAEAEADAEEIAHRGLNARFLFAVPIDPQDVKLKMVRLVAGDVVAEVDDATRPRQVGQHPRLARLDRPAVVVAARGVGRGESVRLVVLDPGQVLQRRDSGRTRDRTGRKRRRSPAILRECGRPNLRKLSCVISFDLIFSPDSQSRPSYQGGSPRAPAEAGRVALAMPVFPLENGKPAALHTGKASATHFSGTYPE